MRATCDQCPEPDMWMCGICGQVQTYDFGRWVAPVHDDRYRYACETCQHDAVQDGGCILNDMEAAQLGLCILSDAETTVRCSICGEAETTDGAPSEATCDGFSVLGWTFPSDGPRCPRCKGVPVRTCPADYPDIFG